MKVFCLLQYQYQANILILGNQYTVKYQKTIKCWYTYQHLLISRNKATLLAWVIVGFKQVKLVSQLHNSKKAICHIMGGCGKKPVLAIDANTSNFLMHLGRYHLERYAELVEAQEKG